MSTILLVTHESTPGADDTGEIGPHLEAQGHEVRRLSLFPDGPQTRDSLPAPELPDTSDIDLVIVFGSYASAWSADSEHWVRPEVAWIRSVIDSGVGYLGICFGAQLLALALGGEVRPAGRGEGGMISVDMAPDSPVGPGPWFAWHSDVVELPQDVEVIGRNDFCVQAFRADRALGLQFHPEVTLELAMPWIDSSGSMLGDDAAVERARTSLRADVDTARANCRELADWAVANLAR